MYLILISATRIQNINHTLLNNICWFTLHAMLSKFYQKKLIYVLICKKSNHLICITRVSLTTTPFPLRNQLFANFIVGHDISWYLQKKSLNLNELKYLYIQPTRYKTILGVHPGRTRADSFFFRFCSWLGHHVLFCASPFWETIWISANGTCQSDHSVQLYTQFKFWTVDTNFGGRNKARN